MAAPYNAEFPQLIGNNDVVMAKRLSSLWNGSITGTLITATLIPAVSTSYVYIKGLYLHLSMNATLATAGQNTITIDVGTTVIFQDIVYIPATAITVPEYRVQIDNFEYVSTVANLAVTVNITTALASGVLSAAIKGGYTTLALGQ